MSLKLLVLTTNRMFHWSNAQAVGTAVIRKHGANNRRESYSSYGDPFFERNKPIPVPDLDGLFAADMPEPGKTDVQMAVYFEDAAFGIPKAKGIADWEGAALVQQDDYKQAYAINAAAKAERADNSGSLMIGIWIMGISTGLVAILGIFLVGHVFSK